MKQVNEMGQGEALPALQTALPYSGNAPADGPERSFVLAVAFHISLDLPSPEVLAVGGPMEEVAVVAVPEAAMHEYYGAMLRKHQIWLPKEFGVMKPIAVPKCMKSAADDQLWFCVFTPDRGHISAAGCRIMNVSQP